ncbi:CPCC family cysteine-rich protein [Chryseobacterium sp. 2R14A]|uniref:CPCC family cysteine-rich protein n=1 Tax=Chryseobacterium sp. 2R14A TaxID=3380353 RepID=UPI003CEBD3D0
MKDIFEFEAFTDNDSFIFTDEIENDFIAFIESKSVFWGGGYRENYIQGGLYCDEDLDIDEENFKNEFLDFFQNINENIQVEINIFGVPKIGVDYLQCFCCGYFTIEERGNHDICPVCFWEDDGETDLDVVSNPNVITLKKGRENFLKFGACEKRFVKDVIKDPDTKFRKEKF